MSGTNDNGGKGAEGTRPSMEEALAALGPPVDRVDKLTHFIGQQLIDITTAFRAMNQRLDSQEAEIAQLRALLLPDNSGGESEGNVLQ